MLAIKVENISKQYRLGQVGTGTLSDDLNRFWYKLRGKEDPYLKIGEVNDKQIKGESDYVWALKDINFEIEQGDTVAIIGKNGAGKSTLLKLLSKVTKPTTGRIRTNGRISSLLEVGTGFNPEMTGRENVYLNGAILGMTRKEITQKIDEIIAFSEVERYIDTPVKRYSSGMRVRLAFSVAVHLESEILIVDEVLAVGDAEFKRKCLDRIKYLNQEEKRTILFVSHNMTTVNKLCQKAILLENGTIIANGLTNDVIYDYLETRRKKSAEKINSLTLKNTHIVVSDFKFIQNGLPTTTLYQGEGFKYEFTVENKSEEACNLISNVEIYSGIGEPVTFFSNRFQNKPVYLKAKDKQRVTMSFSDLYLRKGEYFATLFFSIDMKKFPDKCAGLEEVKLTIESPKSSYFTNENREWLEFSKKTQHGYLPMKIDKLEQQKL